ncbi:DUF3168 domain-containing protein [Yoonia sp.]|uniref:DUF3168 domain-containing protein n=1 Tax=Yoonia sp. TaxID=2212373 RepID=UPI002E08876A|nr:DUF3168 domain-containing protein [Yoonia sp.]
MEEEIRALLLSRSEVTAICGNRIDFGANAQGASFPRVVLWTIGDAEGHNLSGPDGHSIGRIQIDNYALTYGQSKQLSRAVRSVLDGHSGGGFQGVFLAGSRDTREGGTNEADRPFRVSLDFITHFNPT